LNSNSTLISIGQFDLKLNHLLVIGILSLSFSISFLLRSQPAEWGWELNEFDPFFNYRATEYLVNNGLDSYFEWHDDLSWHPRGRDVSSSSQIILHLTTAITYSLFGAGSALYDFTILFPVIFGSLTCIVIFALVRVIGGTTAGLFSALFFSMSMPILLRGQIGWFKSEPLGLFFSILAIYLFLSGISAKDKKIVFTKLVFGGIFLSFSLSAWGGNQFFIIPLGIFFLTLPFLRSDHKFLIWTIPVFTFSVIAIALAFERPGISFVTGIGGLSLVIPTIFLVFCILIQRKSKETTKTRNGLIFLTTIIISGIFFLIINSDSNFMSLPDHRYLNAVNPFLTTTDPLIDSVAEHATTTIQQSFLFHSTLMIFAGIGIWLLLKHSEKFQYVKNDMISFSLIAGIVGVYISSAFIRLEVFASFAIIILSSLGLSILTKEFFSNQKIIKNNKNLAIRSTFLVGFVALLIIPLILPSNSIYEITDNPPTILNGGTKYSISTNDWLDSLEWIKNNTPKDAVIASWWDYGYWIQTKSDRATLADNSTLIDWVIKKIAQSLLNSPEEGWKSLQEMEADYFLIFVSSERFSMTGPENQSLYILTGGGDESKKQWFMRIANQPLEKFIYSDGISGTEYFWENTLLGQMIPYNILAYVNVNTGQQSLTYQPGYSGIYEKNIKLPEDGNGPLKLVYSSPSFNEQKPGPVIGVFIYEINKDFVPLN